MPKSQGGARAPLCTLRLVSSYRDVEAVFGTTAHYRRYGLIWTGNRKARPAHCMTNGSAVAGTTRKSRGTAVHFNLKGSQEEREQRPRYTLTL